jgi:hypothetical protein
MRRMPRNPNLGEIFRANVRQLMRDQKLSGTQIRARGGPPQKTVSNMTRLEAPKEPTLSTVESLARALRVEPWRLLAPGMTSGHDQDGQGSQEAMALYRSFTQADAGSREIIDLILRRTIRKSRKVL